MHPLMLALAAILQESPPPPIDDSGGGFLAVLFGGIGMLIPCVILVPLLAGMWKVFEKAGKPGWAALVPIYNYIVLDEIANRPMWWVAIWFFCGPIAMIVITLDIAAAFGKSTGFAVGMILLPFVFWPMLGFSDARYQRPVR